MGARLVAFRIFGRFEWLNGKQRAGWFEFFFDPDVDNGLTACVEWRPGDSAALVERIPATPIDALAGTALEGVKAGNPFTLSLAGQAPIRLVVPGATLFEQYPLDDGERGPVLRWLLANRFPQGKNTGRSAVALGQRAGDARLRPGFEFHLAIPSPAVQGFIDGVAGTAFPFRVHYDAQRTAGDTGQLAVDWIAAGAEGQKSECAWLDLRTGFDPPTFKSRVLGTFGFCPYNGADHYLYFPRSADVNADKKREALWTSNAKRYVTETLGQFADGTAAIGAVMQLGVQNNKNHNFESIWFANRDTGSQIYFRSAFKPVDGAEPTTKGDLRITDSGLHPLDPFGVGNCLQRANGNDWMLLDLICDWQVSDGDIENMMSDGTTPTGWVAIRLSVAQKIELISGAGSNFPDKDEFETSGGQPKLDYVTPSRLIGIGMRMTRLPRVGLDILSALAPDNAFPHLMMPRADDTLFALAADVPIALVTQPIAAAGSVDAIVWQTSPANRGRWRKVDFGLRLWDKVGGRGLDDPVHPIDIGFSLPGLDGAPGALTSFPARLTVDRTIGDDARSGMISFALEPRDPTPAPGGFQGRLGGLGLSAATPSLAPTEPGVSEDASHWRFRPGYLEEDAGAQARFLAGASDFQLSLHLDDVEPLGVDVPWGDRSGRPRPLLLRLDNGDSANPNFVLTLRERLSLRDDRQFTAQLKQAGVKLTKKQMALRGASAIAALDDGASVPAQYVVLSEQPFSIMRFEASSLASRADEANTTVAIYDSDTRQWSLRRASPIYHYTLPPQGIGESMDKPHRLQILDAAPDQTLPFPVPATAQDGARRHHAVDYRLTSPAEIWIEPSDVERNFLLPEWASYEIFRQRGELGVGSALAGLRAEFLYGIALSVDPSQERGPAATTRVAEIEALLGRPPQRGEQTPQNRYWMRRFARLLDAVARRPERLEFWMRDPSASQPLAPARFADGARFALRDRATLRSPFVEEEGDWSGLPPIARLSPQGLAGGAIWALESRAFCRAFIENPESSGGTIGRIALAPHGGDSDFRAEFLGGKLAIIAEVRAGRVQRQRVEIVGRIGAFWNRAKHVVIYDRTTSASAQFTPDGGLGKTSRRPILRKVEEFVELLEPERIYPDTPNAAPAAPGFLHALRFNATKIHVDSAWSEDVGKTGWQIPLWNRHSARQRPSVYPHPDIVFVSHAEGEEDQSLVAQQCLDPDNLYFYTDADPLLTGDTDRWNPVLGVDWLNLPAPCARHEPRLDARQPQDDTRIPATPRIPRGQRRFTWRLGPAARRAQVNAGRAAKPIYVSLGSLTFSRAQPADDATVGAAISETLTTASRLLADPGLVDAARSALDQLSHAASAGDDNALRAAADVFRKTVKTTSWSDGLASLKLPELAKLKATIGNEPEAQTVCTKLVNDLATSLERKKSLMMAQLRAWLEDASKITPLKPTRDAWIEAVVADIIRVVTPALDEVQSDVGRVQGDVARAQGVVADFQGELLGLFDQATRKLAEIREAFDDGKPWSAARIETYQQRLETVRVGLIGDLASLSSEMRTRLSTELGQVSHGITVAVGHVLDEVSDANGAIRSALGASQSAAFIVLGHVRDGYRDKMQAARGALDAAAAEVEKTYPALGSDLRKLSADLAAASQTINTTLSDAEQQVRDGRAGLDQILTTVFTTLAAQLSSFGAKMTELVDALALVAAKLTADQMLAALITTAQGTVNGVAGALSGLLGEAAGWALDCHHYADDLTKRIQAGLAASKGIITDAFAAIAPAATAINDALTNLKDHLSKEVASQLLAAKVIRPAFDLVLSDADYQRLQTTVGGARDRLEQLLDKVEERLSDIDSLAGDEIAKWRGFAEDACNQLGVAIDTIEGAVGQAVDKALDQFLNHTGLQQLADEINKSIVDYNKVAGLIGQAQKDLDKLRSLVADAKVQAEAYADRVVDSAGKVLNGGLAAAPNNLLRLYAAIASAPSLPLLDFASERMGYYFDALKSVIDTSAAEAWFGRLGSELKALGLSLPFQHLGETLIPDDLSNFDIARIFRNIGGIDLGGLFSGYRLPKSAGDAIHVTHDFDAKQARAWVQIDVDVQLPGRKSLFAIGPFSLDFVDSRLAATVRLEASKDTEKVEQTGKAALTTTVDAMVSGQSMVALQKLVVSFAQSGGLHVDLDPKNIKLNPAFKFIQETLGSIFPDDAGGLTILKQNGIPIGVEHQYAVPPINIMGGTSGISNLAISNHFSLVAYPDFVIANRFALSRIDAPFLFTIFIIGGSGYLTVEAEYRPFTSDLSVMVEAAAGGSAALGFALGPISGSVSISLSLALSYQTRSGRSGGGLSVSLELLIAGNVNVAGIATVNLAFLLRMQYHQSGRIDGIGTVSVSIRICRFYTYKYRSNANYKLRDGGGGGDSANVALLAAGGSTPRQAAMARAERILQARS